MVTHFKDPGDFFQWLAGAIRRSRALSHYRQGREIDVEELTADVPCGDCHKCCENNVQVPVFSEEADRYKTMDYDGFRYLEQTEEGRCVYLIDGKCDIYDERSILCRTYDCRVHVASKMVEPEIMSVATQWGEEWFRDGYRGLILLAIHLAAVDTHKELPGANTIIASDRGLARFPEYLGRAMTKMYEARTEFEKEANDPKIIIPGGRH